MGLFTLGFGSFPVWVLVRFNFLMLKMCWLLGEERLKKCFVHGIWKLVLIAIWWCTWKERNRWIFDDKASSIQDFKLYFLGTLYSWGQVLNGGSKVSFLDFVDKIMHESLRA